MITVVKIGGNVIDDRDALQKFLTDFANLPGPKILVHGGGKLATKLSAKLGIETTMIEGRRVTDSDTIDVVTMVYAGLVNKRLVALLQSLGTPAIGLSGADANVVPAVRRPAKPIDYGFVGDIDAQRINAKFILSLVDQGLTPVFCSINHDEKGQMLNCNADTQAQSIAVACAQLQPTRLVYCFEKAGVLADVDDPESVIAEITPKNYADLRASGAVAGGMIPKIDNALQAVAAGVEAVEIKSAENLNNTIGTTIRPC